MTQLTQTTNTPIGKVLRASTQQFVFGTKVPKRDVPIFGSLVKTTIQFQSATIYGLIFNIEIQDDGMTKMLSVADDVSQEEIEWQRSRRVPVEASVLCVGYQPEGQPMRYSLPAQPPIILDPIYACDDDEMCQFASKVDYFRLIVNNREVPSDELLAASIRLCADAHGDGGRDAYLLKCGRELARLIGSDSARLENLLRRLI